MVKKTAVHREKNKQVFIKGAILVALGCVLFVFTMTFSLSQKQKNLEKQFQITEGKIDSTLSSLGGSMPGVVFKKIKSCERYNVKFKEGDLYCIIGFSVQEPSVGLSSEEVRKVQRAIEGGFQPGRKLGNVQTYDTDRALSCRLDTPPKNSQSLLVKLSFSCRENSSKPFYPYQD